MENTIRLLQIGSSSRGINLNHRHYIHSKAIIDMLNSHSDDAILNAATELDLKLLYFRLTLTALDSTDKSGVLKKLRQTARLMTEEPLQGAPYQPLLSELG